MMTVMSANNYRHSRPDELFDTVGGDRETFLLLVDIYKRDTVEKFAKIRECFALGDRAQLGFYAHALKGTVGPTGAAALMQELVELEAVCGDPQAVCKEQTLDGIEKMIGQVRLELEQFAEQLA